MPGGQPTKYREEYCQVIEDEMAEGYSITATTHLLGGVCKDTVYEWKKVHPAFSDAIKRGYGKGLRYYEKMLRDKTSGKNRKIDTSCLLFVLKTRFHKEYGEIMKLEVETQEITLTGDDGKL